MFVNLHVHDFYSFLDGFNSPKELVQKAKSLGHPAMAITNHGTLHQFVELYKAAKKEGIKPIFGIEFYTTKNIKEKESGQNHLIVWAKNKKGLDNLFKLITIANTEGFYYKPKIDFELLKEHKEGLIVSSACLAGEIPQALKDNDTKKAEEIALSYKEVFGDDFYLEIMANNMDEQFVLNAKIANMAKKLNIELVATSDVHYLEKEDAEAHEIMLAIQTGKTLEDEDRFKFSGDDYYFKDEDEVKEGLFKNGFEEDAKKAIENTVNIANKIDNIEIELGGLLLPEFPIEEGETLESVLTKMVYEKFFEFVLDGELSVDDRERIETELEVICDKGYAGYFLVVEDYVRYARENGIVVGPGRGSAAGALVSYILGITALNPVRYGLLFERFLNPERVSLPDIDIDFSDRQKVIDYVVEKYGRDKVASICNFGTMGAKSVVKDVGRVMNIDYYIMNEEIAKAFPDTPGISIDEALEESEELRMYAKQYPELFKIAKKLEGKPRQLGTHASAVVITPKPVSEFTPIARTTNKQTGEVTYVTSTEMHNSEELGLLKMDFLGLKTISIIDNAIKFIHNRNDLDKFDFVPTPNNIWKLPLDDKEVYDNIYCKADTNGIFQVESPLFKRLLKQMKPQCFEDIIAILAIGRPGPLEAGIAEEYFDCMHGKKTVEYPHNDLRDVLEETYGQMIYQENVMQAAQVLAGFSLGEADILRRGMGKKKIKVLEEMKVKFVEGAKRNGHSEEFANEMFELIEFFAGYGFNKSHSAAYAIISYASAYLKYHFPAEFYAAMMSVEAQKSKKDSNITSYFADCYDKEIPILPPDINESSAGFSAIKGRIRLGLEGINGFGAKAMEEVAKTRPYKDLEDMYKKVNTRTVDKTAFTALIKSGALDSFDTNRNKLIKDYEELREFGSLRPKLFSMEEDVTTSKEDIIAYEIETIDISITHPSKWDVMNVGDEIELEGKIIEKREVTTRKTGKLMAFGKLQTDKNIIKIVIFNKAYIPNHDIFTKGFTVKIKGKKGDGNALLIGEPGDIKLIEGDFFSKAN